MRIGKMIDTGVSTEALREMYNLKDTPDWSLESARKSLMGSHSFERFLKPCLYRPFDSRWCYYGEETMNRHRPEVMQHLLAGNNLGLLTTKREEIQGGWAHALVTDGIATHPSVSPKTTTYLLPLYRYDDNVGVITRRENLTPKFRRWLDDRYGIAHTPEDILGCIYAVLHSPDYRKRYADFLRTDFPRIPFPDTTAEFTRLTALGNDLIAAHLLRTNCTGDLAQHVGTGTSNKVEKVRYDEKAERLYFNKDEWFAPLPPDVFTFPIGGYQPLDKYLKSRKVEPSPSPKPKPLQKAANAIAFTLEKMGEINK